MNTTKSLNKPILLWSFATLFFAFQFILRLSTGILREEIIQKFTIDVIEFGTLAGYYYLGYAGMQIPIGIMLDKFNLRLVVFVCIIISSVGVLTFVATSDWYYLLIGRAMIGAGSAVGFLAVAKVTKTYFPPKYHSTMLGFSLTFGLIGAVFGVTPMKMLFEHFGYYNTFNGLALAGLVIGFMILAINTNSIPHYEDQQKYDSSVGNQIIKLLFNPTILLIGIFGGFMVGVLEGFADLWAMPFFQQVYNMTEINSNLITSFIYIGMCFGGPVLAIVASFFKAPNLMIILTGLLTTIIFAILFYAPSLSFFTSSCIMFILGVLCCYQVLVFTVASSMVDKASAGLTIAIINCINMSFGHLFHKVISILIQSSWNGQVGATGMPFYTRDDFITSLSAIPLGCLIGAIGFAYLSLRTRITAKPRNYIISLEAESH